MAKPDKAVPHMVDVWRRIPGVPMPPGLENKLRSASPLARRFVFDAEACKYTGRLLNEATDLVCEQIEFARPPYPVTYIEFSDMPALFRKWKGFAVQGHEDRKVGYLYLDGRLYVIAGNEHDSPDPLLCAFTIGIDTPQRKPIEQLFGSYGHSPAVSAHPELGHFGDIVKLSYLLGGQRVVENGRTSSILFPRGVDLSYFLANFDLATTIEYPPDFPEKHKRLVDNAFKGSGDLIIGAAAILLIHSRKERNISIQDVPRHVSFFRGKRQVFHTHGHVTIKLGPHETMRKVLFGRRASPVGHDVMGTWVHYHRDRHCVHDWIKFESDDDRPRYVCTKCPTLRVWRRDHSRGRGDRGIHTHDYQVTE